MKKKLNFQVKGKIMRKKEETNRKRESSRNEEGLFSNGLIQNRLVTG